MAKIAIRTATLEADTPEIARLSALLDANERHHAERFRFFRDRRRFIVRRGRLREWLGAATGEVPARLSFARAKFGKPLLLGGGPHFSLSHSGERMMLVWSDVEVGCDIERLDRTLDWRSIAEALYAPRERAALAGMSERAGRKVFFDCWVRKEAFVKALGRGFSILPDTVDVLATGQGDLSASSDDWSIANFTPAVGYTSAVVVRSQEPVWKTESGRKVERFSTSAGSNLDRAVAFARVRPPRVGSMPTSKWWQAAGWFEGVGVIRPSYHGPVQPFLLKISVPNRRVG